MFIQPVSLFKHFCPFTLPGSSEKILSGSSEEELEASLKKWNLMNKHQAELLKPEVFNKYIVKE